MSQTEIAAVIGSLGGPTRVASLVGVSVPAVHQWSTGLRKIPPDRCPGIERATDGRFTVEALRPDVRWARVPDAGWPHPDGRPCIDVAAPADEAAEPTKAAA